MMVRHANHATLKMLIHQSAVEPNAGRADPSHQ
jgi:hypothetical protein